MPDLKGPSKKSIDSALFEALIFLGINGTSTEKSDKVFHNKCSFNKLSHKEAICILHFLFTIINKGKAAKTFRNLWPILDMKQDALFRRAAFEWFKELNQKEHFGKRVAIPLIACVTPGSPKFLQTILSLVCHAIYCSICSKEKDNAALLPPIWSQQRSANLNTKRLVQRLKKFHLRNYTEGASSRNKLLCQLSQTVNKLVDDYEMLVIVEDELQSSIANDSSTICDLEDDIVERSADIVSLWEMVHQFRNCISVPNFTIGALIEKGSLSSIDGKTLVDSSESENLNPNCYTDNQLNLVSVINSTVPILKELEKQSQKAIGTESYPTEIKDHIVSTDISVEQIQAELAILQSSLSLSIKQFNEQIENVPALQEEANKEGLRLCPPTPSYFSKPTPKESLMKSYQLFHLTPDKSLLNKSLKKKLEISDETTRDSLSASGDNQKSFELNSLNSTIDSNLENSFLKTFKSVCKKGNTLSVPPSGGVGRSNVRRRESLQSLLERMSSLIDTPVPVNGSSPDLQWLMKSTTLTTPKKVRPKVRSRHSSAKFLDIFEPCPPRASTTTNASTTTESTLYHSLYDSPKCYSLDPSISALADTNGNSTSDEQTFRSSRSVNFEWEKVKEESKFLPSPSLYDTVVESFVAGELNDDVVLDEDFANEVRRESLQERRGSILQLRSSKFSSPVFSEMILSTSESNILDESDSCLITSFDE